MNTRSIMFHMAALSLLFSTALLCHAEAAEKKVFAFRGASSRLMENSLSSFVLAATLQSDYITMELVMTGDNHLIVFHDIDLAGSTNVAEIFPQRARQDGRYYAIDFTLAEIEQLRLLPHEEGSPASMRIPTFVDALLLLRQMEKITGKAIGIAPEIKKPWFHLHEGKDISENVLELAEQFHYGDAATPLYLTCYDPDELQRIHKNMLASVTINVALVQLIDTNEGTETLRLERNQWVPYKYDWVFTRLGVKLLSHYAEAVGLDSTRLLSEVEDPVFSNFLSHLTAENVKIFALNLSEKASLVPSGINSYTDLLAALSKKIEIDAFVTDSVDTTLAFLNSLEKDPEHVIAGQKEPLFTPLPIKE